MLDENLSPKLVARLSDLFSFVSTEELGLKRASGSAIWSFARSSGFEALFTTDRDFVQMVTEDGPPPKVVRIVDCNFRLRILEALLRREAVRIQEFLVSDKGVLQVQI